MRQAKQGVPWYGEPWLSTKDGIPKVWMFMVLQVVRKESTSKAFRRAQWILAKGSWLALGAVPGPYVICRASLVSTELLCSVIGQKQGRPIGRQDVPKLKLTQRYKLVS